MSNEQAQTPPERCPICQSAILDRVARVVTTATSYDCGLVLREYNDPSKLSEWLGHCRHATAAALRTGATLAPTPLEQARTALVDAAVEAVEKERMNHGLYDAVAAYRALLEPRP